MRPRGLGADGRGGGIVRPSGVPGVDTMCKINVVRPGVRAVRLARTSELGRASAVDGAACREKNRESRTPPSDPSSSGTAQGRGPGCFRVHREDGARVGTLLPNDGLGSFGAFGSTSI